MTRQRSFFIHLMTSEGTEGSSASISYPSFETAYLEVVASIPDIAADVLRRGLDPMKCAFVICDENNRLVETVHFQELVRSRGGPSEPQAQDLLLPVYGCTIRRNARHAYNQLQNTRRETQELLAAGKDLDAKIARA